MNISIFGLGYVGAVSSACFAANGHNVIGVEINPLKIDLINKGQSPIIEKDLPELISHAHKMQLLTATDDTCQTILNTELSIVCVGTPSRSNGSLNTQQIETVCRQIGECLKVKQGSHIVVVRSTILPGTCKELIIPALEKASGKQENKDFFLVYNPEFMREATAVADFYNPPKTVAGSNSSEAATKVLALYDDLPGPKMTTTLSSAEMVKYVDNNFHTLKITFANEVGQLCKKLGLDSHEVMDIFVQDTKLNISPQYLKPGFAFGGSCLPKDLRALNYLAKMNDLDLPLFGSLISSNNVQILSTIKRIIALGRRKIGVAGFSFKAGTDDLRESPVVEVVETLLGKGFDLKLYDKNVSMARLTGANKEYIEKHIPHLASMMVDSLQELLSDREVIVIGNNDEEFKRIVTESREDQIILDLVRIDKNITKRNYEGIYW